MVEAAARVGTPPISRVASRRVLALPPPLLHMRQHHAHHLHKISPMYLWQTTIEWHCDQSSPDLARGSEAPQEVPGEYGWADQHHVGPEALCLEGGQVPLPLEVLHHPYVTAQGGTAADLLAAVQPPAGGQGGGGEDDGREPESGPDLLDVGVDAVLDPLAGGQAQEQSDQEEHRHLYTAAWG